MNTVTLDSSTEEDFPRVLNRAEVLTGRFFLLKRNLYMPRMWIPLKPALRKGSQKKPVHQNIATEWWIVELDGAARLTAALTGHPDVARINSRHIVNKYLIGMLWAHDPDWTAAADLQRRSEIMAEWIERCGFWPFDI